MRMARLITFKLMREKSRACKCRNFYVNIFEKVAEFARWLFNGHPSNSFGMERYFVSIGTEIPSVVCMCVVFCRRLYTCVVCECVSCALLFYDEDLGD